MNILQQIFNDHFDTVANSGISIRDTVFDNVNKMLLSVTLNTALLSTVANIAVTLSLSPLDAKAGNLYSVKRSTAMSFKLVRTSHRHCVFTIPEQLRIFFRKDRTLLDCIFRAVSYCIFYMFRKINKSENFTPGFICVLHTFGRSLQWNPYIHVLLTEGDTGNKSIWRKVTHFDFQFLRKSFCKCLLDHLEKHIGNSFRKVKSFIYKYCLNGFYVYAKPSLTNNKEVLKYIGRYLGRPVIATSRIDNYDGSNVTFHYNRHEDNKLIIETVPATEFIKMLIVHIPDKHFKMIRYYGIYAKKHKNSDKLFLIIPKQKRRFLTSLNAWRTSLLLSFGYDPLKCKCGHLMTVLQICHKGTPLIEIYRNFLSSA